MTTLAIGYIYRGTVHHSFMLSLIRYLEHDRNGANRCVHLIGYEGLYLAQSRNEVVRRFLTTAAEWLLFVDTDIDFTPGQVDMLLGVADEVKAPIVAAFYPTYVNGEVVATWHSTIAAPSLPVTSVVTNELQPIAACGMGFTLIHRRVFVVINGICGESFGHDHVSGHPCGEDVTFSVRANEADYQIMGYGMGVGHTKAHRLTLDHWRGE